MKTGRTLYQSTLVMKKAIQIFLVGVIIFGLNEQPISAQTASFRSPETDELVEYEKNVSAGHINSESSSISEELSFMKNSIPPMELKKSADKVQADSKQEQGESKNVLLGSSNSSDEEEAEIVEDWMLSPREWLSNKE